MNFDKARANMVSHQIRSWDVINKDILNIMLNVHREEFVPIQQRKLAFSDMPLPIGYGQHMMKPVVEGRMLQSLNLDSSHTVLEVGTGSAYVTALLSNLCQQVTSLEIHPELSSSALSKLNEINASNVSLENIDFFEYKTSKQYDRIIITGSLKSLPKKIFALLKPDGLVFAIIGDEPIMEARTYTSFDSYQSHFDTVVAPLEGNIPKQAFIL
ncbi:MAG: protein-L-isoaspartate O-methyltransferase [Proteobacteria bacterium]|nr:protein-L-isoaspartate O-methyltransferase [Pseudomonadota bacterium]